MNYLISLFFLVTTPLCAQSNVAGLGAFRIGITTPDSLRTPEFREQEPAVVKGTLALPCEHIRLFRADTVQVQGVRVTNLVLFFYDNQLFRLSCEYSEPLRRAFVAQHGKGQPTAPRTVSLCDEGSAKRLTLSGETWPNGDVQALAVQAVGYDAHCRPERTSRLTIASQRIMAYTSECDFDSLDPYLEKIWPQR